MAGAMATAQVVIPLQATCEVRFCIKGGTELESDGVPKGDSAENPAYPLTVPDPDPVPDLFYSTSVQWYAFGLT